VPWFKLLHLGAVIVWCGTLLYLPALIAAFVAAPALTARRDLPHGACGWLVLRTERGQHSGVRVACHVVMVLTVSCLLGIAWLVLRKPT
jgi:hypothetical protein